MQIKHLSYMFNFIPKSLIQGWLIPQNMCINFKMVLITSKQNIIFKSLHISIVLKYKILGTLMSFLNSITLWNSLIFKKQRRWKEYNGHVITLMSGFMILQQFFAHYFMVIRLDSCIKLTEVTSYNFICIYLWYIHIIYSFKKSISLKI